MAIAFLRPALAQGEQAGEAGVGRLVLRETQQADAVLQIQPGADQQLDPGPFGRAVGPDDPGERVAVGHADRAVAQLGRPHHQFLRMRAAAQEAEIRRHLQLGVGRNRGGASVKGHQSPPNFVMAVGEGCKPSPTKSGVLRLAAISLPLPKPAASSFISTCFIPSTRGPTIALPGPPRDRGTARGGPARPRPKCRPKCRPQRRRRTAATCQ